MTKVDTSAFEQSVQQYTQDMVDQVLNEVEQAAQEIRNQAIRKTPVNTGALRAGWQVRKGRTATGGWVEVSNSVPYAAAVEYGTRAHTITARNSSVLTDGKAFFGQTVNHPGTKPRRMLRQAVDKVVPQLKQALMRLTR